MFCSECEYPADDLTDLGEHMFEFHPEKYMSKINCHYCDDSFDNKESLMKHRKEAHAEKVQQCIFFSAGSCDYGEELCWFNHEKISNNPLKAATDLNCKICNKSFKIRSEFMRHRKHDHSETVPPCTNIQNGTCIFGPIKCWFRHTETVIDTANTNLNLEDQTLTEKLFVLMEKFAQRLEMMENQIRTTT
jgi:hypothetical protein